MRRAIVTACLILMPLLLGAAPAPESCTCATAKATHGWCEAHARGYVAAVEIRSRHLYDTLDAHGHTLDLGTFQCASCKQAIASDGFCEEHRIGFVGRQAYFSRLTYELARGEPREPSSISCRACRKNARSLGWCDKHGVGMVGSVAVKDRLAYDHAAKAVGILKEASEAAKRCEHCAMAMVTDTQCPFHRITYKDGKPVPAPAVP
jgi:hypothetical protein